MPTREELICWDREIIWHGFTQMAEYEPLIFASGHGSTLVDIDGNEYLDGVSSLWCNVHGHGHPRLNEAMIEQLSSIAHCTNLGASNPAAIKLAKKLVELAPAGLDHVFFSSDGSSAVEVALKMTFQYWQQCSDPRPQKTRYIALGEAYHGDTIGGVSVGGVQKFHALFRPLLFEALRLPSPDTYRLPENVSADTACRFFLNQLEELLEQRHDEVAALVIEPLVQGAAGMILHPEGYLRGVRELTRKYDVLLIADEIAVGMGRTGTMFACEQEDVHPDLMCLGKGLSGGYLPMSATLASDEIWQAFLGRYDESKTFFHGHTYGGNPLAAAVALASLDVFDDEQTLRNMTAKIEWMRSQLARIAEHPQVGSVRQRGFMVGVELVQDRSTRQPYPMEQQRGARVCRHALSEGVWLRPLGDVVIIMPPLSITIDELERIMNAAKRGIVSAT